MLKGFLKDLWAYLPSRLLPAITAILTTPILTRLFTPAEYGYWALASGVTGFLLALAGSGFGSATVRFLPAYKAKLESEVFFASMTILISVVIAFVSALSFSVLFLLRDHLSTSLYPLLIISILIFITQVVFNLFSTVTRAQERSGLFTTFQLVSYYGGLGIGLLLVITFNLQVEGMLWGTLITFILALPFLIYTSTRGVKIHPQYFNLPDARRIWQYAWPLALGNVAMWALRLSDRFLISFFRSPNEVGLYSVAYNISGKSIEMIVSLFLLGVSPMIMNTWETQGQEATEKAMVMVTRLYLILCLPAAVGLTVLALPIVSILTSEAYHEGYRIVGYVALASFALGLSNIAHMGIAIGKKARRLGTNQIVAALANVGLNIILVPKFGFVAAGITSAIGYMFLFILQALASRRYLTWRFPFRTLRNVVIASTFMGLIVWGLYGFSGNRSEVNILYLLLSIIVAVLVYFVSLIWLDEASTEEKTTILRLFKKSTGRLG